MHKYSFILNLIYLIKYFDTVYNDLIAINKQKGKLLLNIL